MMVNGRARALMTSMCSSMLCMLLPVRHLFVRLRNVLVLSLLTWLLSVTPTRVCSVILGRRLVSNLVWLFESLDPCRYLSSVVTIVCVFSVLNGTVRNADDSVSTILSSAWHIVRLSSMRFNLRLSMNCSLLLLTMLTKFEPSMTTGPLSLTVTVPTAGLVCMNSLGRVLVLRVLLVLWQSWHMWVNRCLLVCIVEFSTSTCMVCLPRKFESRPRTRLNFRNPCSVISVLWLVGRL